MRDWGRERRVEDVDGGSDRMMVGSSISCVFLSFVRRRRSWSSWEIEMQVQEEDLGRSWELYAALKLNARSNVEDFERRVFLCLSPAYFPPFLYHLLPTKDTFECIAASTHLPMPFPFRRLHLSPHCLS